MNAFDELKEWYKAQCNGDWEHSYGVKINTLDNPGWMVTIRLSETRQLGREFRPVAIENSPTDWIITKIENDSFVGYGDPDKLEAIVRSFIDWAKTDPNWLLPADPPTQAEEDRALLDTLGEEIGPEQCQTEKCARLRVEHSVMCKLHHFEMIKGRTPISEGGE